MIYCVVPEELEDELLEKLQDYYADDPHVEVIVDRRRRRGGELEVAARSEQPRIRRRARVTGDFPKLELGD
jgi:hypothetical protein